MFGIFTFGSVWAFIVSFSPMSFVEREDVRGHAGFRELFRCDGLEGLICFRFRNPDIVGKRSGGLEEAALMRLDPKNKCF